MTYATLAAAFLAGACLVLVAAVVWRRPRGTWWWATGITAAVLLVLTVVFDSLMIAVDLFRFDEDALSGTRLLLAPVEDLAWPLAAVALLPALWLVLDREKR